MCEVVRRFGQRVKFFRTEQGYSQEKLAELCGLHPTYIGQVERGEKNCTLESAEKIAKGLDIPLETLLTNASAHHENDKTLTEIYDLALRLSEKDRNDILFILEKIVEIIDRK